MQKIVDKIILYSCLFAYLFACLSHQNEAKVLF